MAELCVDWACDGGPDEVEVGVAIGGGAIAVDCDAELGRRCVGEGGCCEFGVEFGPRL